MRVASLSRMEFAATAVHKQSDNTILWCYNALCIQARLTPEAAAQLLPENDGPEQPPGEDAHETPRSPSLPAPLLMQGRLQDSSITSSTWRGLHLGSI